MRLQAWVSYLRDEKLWGNDDPLLTINLFNPPSKFCIAFYFIMVGSPVIPAPSV
jgi:hypothetical protein